ncbi:MAG: polysaccharide biosynthesis/export family protein [Planctomycetota bacterium]
MRMICRCALLIVLVAIATGCRNPIEQDAILARAKTLETAPDYTIGEGDEITIQILGDFDATGQYSMGGTVRPDGKITFPGYGEIEVKGKTTQQLRAELQTAFGEKLGLRAPEVHVSVSGYASKQVYLIGEFNNPGAQPYTDQMRVADLLARNGNVPLRASPNRALLFRDVNGEMKVYHIHLNDFWKKGDFTTNYYVRPGDYLYMPRNFFTKTGDTIAVIMSPIRGFFSVLSFGNTTANIFIP